MEDKHKAKNAKTKSGIKRIKVAGGHIDIAKTIDAEQAKGLYAIYHKN